MVHSHGYRSRTRKLFAREFGQHGPTKLSTYMTTYKVGDYVDIKVNASVHKGMPYKIYHGKTGKVFNVGKSSLGVLIDKRVRHRYIEKRVVVRLEHVQPSKCRQEFLDRVKNHQRLVSEAKAQQKPVPSVKRVPLGPKGSTIVDTAAQRPILVHPVPYESLL
jgi:large subunit ribosomal protein L21e